MFESYSLSVVDDTDGCYIAYWKCGTAMEREFVPETSNAYKKITEAFVKGDIFLLGREQSGEISDASLLIDLGIREQGSFATVATACNGETLQDYINETKQAFIDCVNISAVSKEFTVFGKNSSGESEELRNNIYFGFPENFKEVAGGYKVTMYGGEEFKIPFDAYCTSIDLTRYDPIVNGEVDMSIIYPCYFGGASLSESFYIYESYGLILRITDGVVQEVIYITFAD